MFRDEDWPTRALVVAAIFIAGWGFGMLMVYVIQSILGF